jgi:hypothetical protein
VSYTIPESGIPAVHNRDENIKIAYNYQIILKTANLKKKGRCRLTPSTGAIIP